MFLLRMYMSWIGLGLGVFQFNQLPQAVKSLTQLIIALKTN